MSIKNIGSRGLPELLTQIMGLKDLMDCESAME